ncbi:MAG: hypothetical protein USCAAHI_02965 [Beijerinckiaceae bacterium]|jgi:hypothetical protein|nr:MAG: hypothetical protein USCAAHI_02965 [Beijerinckiaceae bacterium]
MIILTTVDDFESDEGSKELSGGKDQAVEKKSGRSEPKKESMDTRHDDIHAVMRNRIDQQKEAEGIDVKGRTGWGRDGNKLSDLAPFQKEAKQNGTTLHDAAYDYRDCDRAWQRDPRSAPIYEAYRRGHQVPREWIPWCEAQHREDRATNAIRRSENKRDWDEGERVWLAEYVDSGKVGNKAWRDANPDAALLKARKAYNQHRLSRKTTELMDNHFSADTRAHREHMEHQRELARGVARRMQ